MCRSYVQFVIVFEQKRPLTSVQFRRGFARLNHRRCFGRLDRRTISGLAFLGCVSLQQNNNNDNRNTRELKQRVQVRRSREDRKDRGNHSQRLVANSSAQLACQQANLHEEGMVKTLLGLDIPQTDE